jgi:regulation of enolase protein 1 (concanavalin A-like superfamily)
MPRATLLVALLAASAATSAPVPKEDGDTLRMRQIYGTPHDPDKGAQFKPSGASLQIVVSKDQRLIRASSGTFNAPRVWRDVKGDFTATVRVSFLVRAEIPAKHNKERAAHAGGGLIVWVDANNYLMVTRDEQAVGDKPGERFRSEARVLGRIGGDVEYPATNRSGSLRVQRKGKQLDTSYSTDGQKWTALGSLAPTWADEVKVGVVAENNFAAPFEIVFDEYTLTPAKD